MLKINEIFYSIQGEGHNVGLPAVFCRLSGCNQACKWCDTKYHTKGRYALISEIIKEIDRFKCRNVVITGGEPTIQGIEDLARALNWEGYYTCLETNGSNKFFSLLFDWITISPKDKKVEMTYCNECKVVWTGKEDLTWFKQHILADHYYLQPCSNKNIKETIDKVKETEGWKLSIQLHKLLSIR